MEQTAPKGLPPASYAFNATGDIFNPAGVTDRAYESGSLAGEAQTLIHEFGHATGALVNDTNQQTGTPDPSKETENNKAIEQHCNKLIDSFPGAIQTTP